MPTYKFTYFNSKALGEPIRFLFAYGKIDYEDIRIDFANEWGPAIKSKMPMGQIPILEVDGKTVHQSLAITRYMAREVGLAGANSWEDLEIDLAVDTVNDLRAKIAAVHYETDAAVQEARRGPLNKEIIPFYLEKLEEIAKLNNGHLALKKLTWADFYFAGILDYLSVMVGHDLVAKHPNLKKVVDNVLSIETIKKWVAKRPVTQF